MDFYSTRYLNGVVVPSVRPNPKLFTMMFDTTIMSDRAEILLDRTNSAYPRMTPFVHPMAKGRVVEGQTYATDTLRPAYLKDLRAHYPDQYQERLAGEAIGGSMTVEQRMRASIVSAVQDQLDMLSNRLEAMAAEAVIHGVQTINGEGFANVVVDFRRAPETKIVLSGNDAWNLPIDPTSDDAIKFLTKVSRQLEQWAATQRDIVGGTPDVVIMEQKAWQQIQSAMTACQGKGWMDTSARGFSRISVDLTPQMADEMGLSAKGTFGDFTIYTYQAECMDPETGTLVRAIPDNTIIMICRRLLMGVRHYGCIRDIDALRPLAYYADSWTEKNPSLRMLQLQSAPLMVPYRPNAVLTIKVKA